MRLLPFVFTLLVASAVNAADPIHAVLLKGEQAREADPATLAKVDFDEVWIWTAERPPVKRTRGQRAEFGGASRTRRITVNVAGLPKELQSSGAVLGGPYEMWQAVPESLLPTYPVVRGRVQIAAGPERWRFRYVGPGRGSWWFDARPEAAVVNIPTFAAKERRIELRSHGQRVVRANLTIGNPRVEHVRGRLWGRFSATGGVVTVTPLPSDSEVSALVTSPDFAPFAFVGPIDRWPPFVELDEGATLKGRLIDEKQKAVGNAKIDANGWVRDDVLAQYALTTHSDGEGRWRLAHVPRTRSAISFSYVGLTTVRQTVAVLKNEIDLGDITLNRGVQIKLSVHEPTGEPIAGATAWAPGVTDASTDRAGIAILKDVDSTARLRLTVSAPGYINATQTHEPPLTNDIAVTLRRSFVLKGRFVDDEEAPVLAPKAVIKHGNVDRSLDIADDGSFSFDLEPGRDAELVLSGSNVQQLNLPITQGREGEIRDLGVLHGRRGFGAHGFVINAATGQPIAGVRVWTPQSSPLGEVLPWVRGLFLETRTSSDGEFLLTGLGTSAALLRFDAPGLARVRRQVSVDPSSSVAQLGTLIMSAGATVMVHSESVTSGSARIDPSGTWNELDMLTAPVTDGTARLDHVPPGDALLTVGSGESVQCEKRITVPDGSDMDVRCDDHPPTIEGRVLAGDAPAGAGMLTWSMSPAEGAVIMNRLSSGGIRQQQAYGGGPSSVAVPVDDQGSFSTNELRPTVWTVSWFPAGGGSAPPKTVTIEDKPSSFVTLKFETGVVSGRVTESDGAPAPAARVADVDARMITVADPEGRFTITGLPYGVRHLRATTPTRSSAVVDVELRPDQAVPPVTLVLDDKLRTEADIAVEQIDGSPATGAFVILETTSGEGRLLTTDATGHATATFPGGLAGRLRVAVMHSGNWSFGDWRESSEGPIKVKLVATGSLIVKSGKRPVDLEITTSNGWALGAMFRRVGVRLAAAPDQPARIDGLPAGAYRVTYGGTFRDSVVKDRDVTTISIDD